MKHTTGAVLVSSRIVQRVSATTSIRRKLLSLAVIAGMGGLAFEAGAQSTTGSIFGQVNPGETVTVTSSTGLTRQATADSSGRYRVGNLPLGSYSVSLSANGNVVDKRDNVTLTVNAGTEVSFASKMTTSLEAMTVNANALPPIDVSSVDSRTVINAAQLAKLPLARTAEAIALLAPGAVAGSPYFGGPNGGSVVSFGGSSVSENAYYVNGYNTTDPLNGIGGITLPYGAIDQQEVYTGGYSAMYGRSDGGVISQVGKRGTNDWHYGAQVIWAPKSLAADRNDVRFPNRQLPPGYGYTDDTLPGSLYRAGKGNSVSDTVYSAYVGGPLIKDKLFFFVAAEAEKQDGKSTTSSISAQPNNNYYSYRLPKYYAKLDWNINESNIIELTSMSSKSSYDGTLYNYDYNSGNQGGFIGYPAATKTGSDVYVGKYTGYITDDLTVSATYGQNRMIDYLTIPGVDPSLPYLSGANNQDPSLTGGTPIRNGVTTLYGKAPNASAKSHGLRLDVEYKLGDHQLAVGIDNMHYTATDEGQQVSGPGYAWIFGRSSRPDVALVPGLGVGAPGGSGYYASRYVFTTTTSMSVDQKAQYLEDRWQVNDRWLLSLGIRNDQFTNYNNAGQAYVKNKDQWAPRLGFSWDVFGDSSMKVYGNLGRYYLALPASVAIRGASASTYTYEYFAYSGIDPATGAPTGLRPLGPGPVSQNGEFGQTPDPKTVTASNLKSQYQDEAILGFSKTLGDHWVFGAKGTVRKLRAAIDDVCDFDAVANKAIAEGVDPDKVNFPNSCLIFNPGRTNTFLLANKDGSGYSKVTMTNEDFGFKQGAKRKYYALDLFLEHPFDGKWQGRVDYTFSRSYGNTEGQVLSTTGQDDVSKTADWDFASLMDYSNGVLSNDRRHQIKAYGSYQVAPEWMVSGAIRIMSGSPRPCLGYYGNNESDPSNYGSDYHFCNGKPAPLGSTGRLPWTKQIDLGVTYRPGFAKEKLGLNLTVFNVLNEQKATYVDATYETAPYTVSNTYGMPLGLQQPRYVRLSANYDF